MYLGVRMVKAMREVEVSLSSFLIVPVPRYTSQLTGVGSDCHEKVILTSWLCWSGTGNYRQRIAQASECC